MFKSLLFRNVVSNSLITLFVCGGALLSTTPANAQLGVGGEKVYEEGPPFSSAAKVREREVDLKAVSDRIARLDATKPRHVLVWYHDKLDLRVFSQFLAPMRGIDPGGDDLPKIEPPQWLADANAINDELNREFERLRPLMWKKIHDSFAKMGPEEQDAIDDLFKNWDAYAVSAIRLPDAEEDLYFERVVGLAGPYSLVDDAPVVLVQILTKRVEKLKHVYTVLEL